jgi:hypothetical protein
LGFHNEETGPPSKENPASINNSNVRSIDATPAKSSNGSKRQLPFAKVPTQVARDASLSIRARHIYTLLVSYAWNDGVTWVSQSTLAKDMGLSDRRSVIPYLKELEAAGLIRIKRERGRNNRYIIRELQSGERDQSREHDRYPSRGPDTTKKQLRRHLETETALERPFPENGNGSHITSTPSSPSFGSNEEPALVTPTRLVAPEGQVVPDEEQVENGNHRTCRLEIPRRARYVRLMRQAESDPHSLDWRELYDLRRVMLDNGEGEPCILHRGGLALTGPCPECAAMASRLYEAMKVTDDRPERIDA